MKTIKFMFVAVLAAIVLTSAYARTQPGIKTETIKVSGNCGLCKARIEKAAKIDGVSKADWNQESKILTLVYNPAKVNSDEVQKKIADAGHDTEKYKAEQKVYDKLPGCCQYK